MLSSMRAWTLVGFTVLGILATGPLMAQDRKAGEPPQRKGANVFNVVEGRSTIIVIKPEGARVKQGELVCELDSPTLKVKVANQEIATKGAEAAYKIAKLNREEAETTVSEYMEEVHKQDLEIAEAEIALARSDLKRAQDRVEWAKQMYEKKYVSLAQLTSEKLALQRASFTHEQAQTRLKVLEQFTRDKTLKELQSEVEKAKADELARRAAYEREQELEKRLANQVEACKVSAPTSGLVSYTRPIEVGAVVRKGQLLLRVVPEDEPKAETK